MRGKGGDTVRSALLESVQLFRLGGSVVGNRLFLSCSSGPPKNGIDNDHDRDKNANSPSQRKADGQGMRSRIRDDDSLLRTRNNSSCCNAESASDSLLCDDRP